MELKSAKVDDAEGAVLFYSYLYGIEIQQGNECESHYN